MFHALDVNFLGHPNVIASCLLEGGSGGVALVDPGPTTSLAGLRAALAARGHELGEVDAILLTHIHLDHAGATGAILREHGGIRVYVHERGAPHMIEPSRLMQSASRLYGDQMQRLWGEMAPVPQENVCVLRGGERIHVAGREFQVEYTPGHASHHVSYFDQATGTAFVGDTAGIRIGEALVVLPPTPPPDIDLEAWDVSVERVLGWRPDRLFLTHFGAFEQPRQHLEELRARTREWASLVKASLADPALEDDQRMTAFAREVTDSLVRRVGDATRATFALAVPFEHCWMGLARYLRKKGESKETGSERQTATSAPKASA